MKKNKKIKIHLAKDMCNLPEIEYSSKDTEQAILKFFMEWGKRLKIEPYNSVETLEQLKSYLESKVNKNEEE